MKSEDFSFLVDIAFVSNVIPFYQNLYASGYLLGEFFSVIGRKLYQISVFMRAIVCFRLYLNNSTVHKSV